MRLAFRDQWDENADSFERNKTIVIPRGEPLTQQQFRDDADLNVIVARFGITDGAIPTPKTAEFYNTPVTDFGEGLTLREVLDHARAAKEHFESLPAKLKNRFDNKPERLHEFVMDPDNTDEAVRLGLLTKVTPPPVDTPKDTE